MFSWGSEMRESDADYFVRRAREEEQAARAASDGAAAEIHWKLARKYAAMATEEGAEATSTQTLSLFPNLRTSG